MTPPKKSIHVKATKNENEKMKGGAIANSNDSTSGQSNVINMNLPWNEIKKHEILCMTYEDDRRRLFLQQQIEQERLNHQRKHEEQLKKVEMQQKIQMQMLSYAKANTNQQNSIRSIRAVPATNHFENDEDFEVYRHQHSSNTSINEDDEDFPDFEAEEENKSVSDGMDTDVNSAIAALSQRQILYMVGRRDVAYEWCVNSILTTNNSNEEEEVSDYELTWYKNGMKEGCVSLLDILSIELGPGTGSNQAAMADLVCHIAVSNSTHSNPRALKKSGGRPIISIRFPNSSDCKLFSKQLELLRQILL